MTAVKFAFDKSMRSVDQDGRLHVQLSNISKATVNPYRGNEIPDWETKNLDANKVYWLFRDPEELAKAAPTFNNIPILDRHIPVHVEEPQKEYVVGSTGTDAQFNDPYLCNSLVIWDAGAIAGIETKQQCELSSSYRYDAEMTPGLFAGVKYDGIMRNIRGNHVALVDVGRAGPDVVVCDSKLSEKYTMKLSAKATAVRGALKAFLIPRLAQDAQIGDLAAIVGKVKAANFAKEKASIVDKVTKTFTPKLAKDADLAGLVELIDALEGDDEDDKPASTALPANDGTPSEQLLQLLNSAGLSDEVLQQVTALVTQLSAPATAADADPEEGKKDDKVSKPAMDAAINVAIRQTEAATVKRMHEIRQAEKDVAPLIGEVVAMDSAAEVYKLALDHASVDLTDVHPSAYKSMVALLKKQTSVAKPRVAMDSGAKSFSERFPNAGKMKGGV